MDLQSSRGHQSMNAWYNTNTYKFGLKSLSVKQQNERLAIFWLRLQDRHGLWDVLEMKLHKNSWNAWSNVCNQLQQQARSGAHTQKNKEKPSVKNLGVGFQSSQTVNSPWIGTCAHNSQIFLPLKSQGKQIIISWHCSTLNSSWIPVNCCCRSASCCSSFNDLGFRTASFAFTSRFRGTSAGDVGPNGTAGCVLDPMGLGQTTLSTDQLGSETRPMVITWCEYCTLGLCYNATKTSCNVHGDLVQSFSGEDAFSYSTGWTCCESCFLLIRNKLCNVMLTEISPSMLSFHSGFSLRFVMFASCHSVPMPPALPQDISNMLWALATLNISTALSQRCVDEAPLERLHGQVWSRWIYRINLPDVKDANIKQTPSYGKTHTHNWPSELKNWWTEDHEKEAAINPGSSQCHLGIGATSTSTSSRADERDGPTAIAAIAGVGKLFLNQKVRYRAVTERFWCWKTQDSWISCFWRILRRLGPGDCWHSWWKLFQKSQGADRKWGVWCKFLRLLLVLLFTSFYLFGFFGVIEMPRSCFTIGKHVRCVSRKSRSNWVHLMPWRRWLLAVPMAARQL